MPWIIPVLAVAGAAYQGVSSSQQASAQKKAANDQAEVANNAAAENRANAAQVKIDAENNAKQLQQSTIDAEEAARKDEMRRRAGATKTLLSGSSGDLSTADTGKKVLLGA
jgi:long-subunit fatty acid transport protein